MTIANSRKKWPIPDDILTPILSEMHKSLGKCCDNFIDYEWDLVKEQCGAEYAAAPREDVRRQGVNLRKRGVLGSVNGHGPGSRQPLSDEYKAVLRSAKFREYFDKVCQLFGGRCAVCNNGGKIEPHHRTYERLGCEEGMDCIPVCRKCHTPCDTRRRRQSQHPAERPLFTAGLNSP